MGLRGLQALAIAATLASGCLAAGRSPFEATTPPRPPVPPASAPSPGPGPTEEPSAAPTPVPSFFAIDEEASSSKIPFVAGERFGLFYYDPRVLEVYEVVGAGQGIANPSFIHDDRYIGFEQVGEIWAWDRILDLKIAFGNVNAIPAVADPEFSADASIMAFHNPDGVFLWLRKDLPAALLKWPDLVPAAVGSPSASPVTESGSPPAPEPPRVTTSAPPALPGTVLAGQVVELATFASIARDHGGIVDARIDGPGDRLAVNTGDGRLWVYSLRTGGLALIADTVNVGNGRVESIAIDPSGSLVVFGSGPHIFMLYITSGVINPLPQANRAQNLVRAHDPTWISRREFHYLADLPDGRINQYLRYNWITETVRAAFFFNNVLGEGLQFISDPR